MISVRVILTVLLSLSTSLFALADVQVTAGIESANSLPDAPLTGIITITHDVNNAIDNSSFRLEGKPLKVDFVKEARMSSTGPVVVSFYRFQIPAHDPGLYMLPEISVNIANKTYKSIATTFEVPGVAQPSSTSAPVVTSSTLASPRNAALKLEALVENPQPFYPGQHAQLTYRFYFQGDIALTAETLPLLDAKGFQKIGDKVITDTQEGGWSIQTIVQEVKAISPGEFVFPESNAEGYGYQENPITKKRTYIQPKLQATVDPVTIVVSPLPGNAPLTFTGAIGSFTIKANLLSPSSLFVGDKITLALSLSSRDSYLEDVTLPSLNQPGIKGLFRLSTLPISGTVQGDTKRFLIDLYPLSTSVSKIPALAFSYFDPIAGQYVTLQSDPIPLTVKERQSITPPPVVQPQKEPTDSRMPLTSATPVQPATLEALEISSNQELSAIDLNNYWFGTWWGVFLIPIAIALLLLQYYLERYRLRQRMIAPIKTSEEIWNDALNNSKNPKRFYYLLTQAFLLRLKETGQISSSEVSPEELSPNGEIGKVRSLLCGIQEKRFTGSKLEVTSVIKEASALFQDLRKEGV